MEARLVSYVKVPHFSSALSDQLGQEAEEWISWLANYGADPRGGVTRLLYSPVWQEAQRAIAARMDSAGMITRFDRVGNLYGMIEGRQLGKSVLTGSHIDTVICGGRYDGALGIIAGMIATQYLRREFGTPNLAMEVVSFCEEEGSRFPITCWGSGNTVGIEAFQSVPDVHDAQGISLQEAMTEAGFGISSLASPLRFDVAAFLELHIEQGACLEKDHRVIGIVEHIVGQRRYAVQVMGEANHAGTTPMKWRKDALAGAVEMIHQIGCMVNQVGNGLTATVGRMDVQPNVPNVIPGQVQFTVDIRHSSEPILNQFCLDVLSTMKKIGEESGLDVQMQTWTETVPVPMSEHLITEAEDICLSAQVPFRRMASGAGHDAQLLAAAYPTALLFVPSCGGISHSPREYTNTEDIAMGIWVLIKMLYRLAYRGEE